MHPKLKRKRDKASLYVTNEAAALTVYSSCTVHIVLVTPLL